MSYQALELDGNGYASIADASQKGLDMGLSDFMIEGWIKTSYSGANQIMVAKASGGIWHSFQLDSDGRLRLDINDGSTRKQIFSVTGLSDGLWHYVVAVADRSGNAQIYVDGSASGSAVDITAVLTLDNNGTFYVGANPNLEFQGFLDEQRIWNFGKDGLPGDWAAYITWRAAARNRFLDISNYSSGAWNGYADADRIERITKGDLDDDNGDFESAGADGVDISTNTDWTKNNTAAEVDDEGGSGVTSYNGSTFCAKIHTATGDVPWMEISGANLDTAFADGIGDWYEISLDYKTLNCTKARFRLANAGNSTDIFILMTSTSWTTAKAVFQLVDNNDVIVVAYSHYGSDEVGNEVVWIDNISIKRIGLVARYKFSGNYNDETSNANHLTAGGTGNTFPGYSLRSKAQKMLLGVG